MPIKDSNNYNSSLKISNIIMNYSKNNNRSIINYKIKSKKIIKNSKNKLITIKIY